MTVTAGKLRPSQFVTQFGPGCLVDLPELSMVIAGLDNWHIATTWRLGEPRLQRALGVSHFKTPPYLKHKEGVGGIPALVFPRFLVCPRCQRLAQHENFEFTEKSSRHICKAGNCRGKGNASAFPARFMVACPNGHLDDFPWHHWVHPEISGCTSELLLRDSGATGSITDISVSCTLHQTTKSLSSAFGVNGANQLPSCSGNRPWLDDHDPEPCEEKLRVLLRGASNAYFSVTSSALSIPPWSDPIQLVVSAHEDALAKVDSHEALQAFLAIVNLPELAIHDSEQLWVTLKQLRGLEDADPAGLRRDEYSAFTSTSGITDYRSEFKIKTEQVPPESRDVLGSVVKALRLREVRALRGFTRIDAVPDIGDMGEVSAVQAGLAPISRSSNIDWLPGVELRGEGIFVTLNIDALTQWEQSEKIVDYQSSLISSQEQWFSEHGLENPRLRHPRFVLIHSLSHLLMRRFELDAGYAGSSLRERIYCDETMAGFLIYTATPDSEGTLGGLVELARPDDLGPMLNRALESAELCANDPFCASRHLGDPGSNLNGAACHACLLLPETSCEHANRYLDRAVLVQTLDTVGDKSLAFVNR